MLFFFFLLLFYGKIDKIIGKVNNIKINQFLKIYINCLIIFIRYFR